MRVPFSFIKSGFPTTIDALFGATLAHVWDSYNAGTEVWTDRVGGLNATPQTNGPAGATRNGHVYPVFDGIDTGMAAADVATLDGLSSWCIFGAFKTNAGAAQGAIVDHSLQFYVELAFGAGAMYADDSGGGTGDLTGSEVVDDNAWHRFIVTVTGLAAKLYVDGVLDASTTFQALPLSANPILLGVTPGGTVTDSGVLIVGIATRGVTVAEAGYLDDILVDWIGVDTADVRTTEAGDARITEAGDARATES
jgi:hypothetical protein